MALTYPPISDIVGHCLPHPPEQMPTPTRCSASKPRIAKRILFILCLSLLGQTSARATPQLPDRIEYGGIVYEFGSDFSSPLYKYLQANQSKWPQEFPVGGSKIWSSNLQRGHIALYRVAEGKLWLVSIEVPVADDEIGTGLVRTIDDRTYAPFPLARLFPDCGLAVHVTWFSGDLSLTRPPTKAELAADKNISTRHETLTFNAGVLTFATKPTIPNKLSVPLPPTP